MDVLYPCCAGLDVHKDTVVACVRVASSGAAKSEVRTFDTTTPGLLALSAWLAEASGTHVAMEATGSYWKPVWHILADGDVTLIRANEEHVIGMGPHRVHRGDVAGEHDIECCIEPGIGRQNRRIVAGRGRRDCQHDG
mgnify:CR=1 FL=1